ncbi:hypothetical protein D3C75_769740 [compost metagenome]
MVPVQVPDQAVLVGFRAARLQHTDQLLNPIYTVPGCGARCVQRSACPRLLPAVSWTRPFAGEADGAGKREHAALLHHFAYLRRADDSVPAGHRLVVDRLAGRGGCADGLRPSAALQSDRTDRLGHPAALFGPLLQHRCAGAVFICRPYDDLR